MQNLHKQTKTNEFQEDGESTLIDEEKKNHCRDTYTYTYTCTHTLEKRTKEEKTVYTSNEIVGISPHFVCVFCALRHLLALIFRYFFLWVCAVCSCLIVFFVVARFMFQSLIHSVHFIHKYKYWRARRYFII